MILRAIEIVTTGVLLAVAVVLGWLVVASIAPEAVRWASPDVEVIVTLILLGAALLLVSLVALVHTRSRDLP